MEMDHSYSKGRNRVQKTDHCYFTVGKKTPQLNSPIVLVPGATLTASEVIFFCHNVKVVLRKAQHLKEQLHDGIKSAVGQDHSYVRAEHSLSASSFDCGTTFEIESPLRIASDLCSVDLLWPSVARDYNGLFPASPEKLVQKTNSLNCISLTLEGDVSRRTAVEALLALDCVGSRCSVMDDLQCWIGSIQLDHTYGGSGVVSLVEDSNPCDADHTYETCIADGSVSWSSQYHLDHPYDSRGGQRVSVEAARNQTSSSVPDTKGLDQIWEIEPVQDQLGEKQRCVDKRVVDENSGSANDDPTFIFHQYGDHAYEATAGDPLNVIEEFRSDHSYDIKSSSGACDSSGCPDWWDHAYVVDRCSSRSTIESCSYSCDVGLSIAGWGVADGAVGEALG